jgi:pyruvate,water dikinase
MMTTEIDARPNAPSLVVPLVGTMHPADVVGAKAAPLARAAAAGHRVPRGVVVTTAASSATLGAALRELDAALPKRDGARYAVRSSAVGEDGKLRSFAGQLETDLGVPRDGLGAAIERCRASASALRALRYGHGKIGKVAVIVQEMVDADAAGVAFSADPRTGERGVAVIEAVRGLGDRLVSGAADPEAWRACASSCDRTREGDAEVLSAADARRVADLAFAMETVFGAPQDIEWALSGGELYLLQSRPITALPAVPVPVSVEPPKGSWDRDDHHAVLSPLGWGWFQPYPKAMARAMKQVGMPLEDVEVTRVGGHLYMRFVMGGGESTKMPPRWVLWLATRLVPSLRRANRMATELLDGETYLEVVSKWENEWRPELRRRIDELFVADPSTLDDAALLERIRLALELSACGLEYHAQLGGPGLFGMGKLVLFAEDHLGWDGARVQELLAGCSRMTTELHGQVEAIVHAHARELDPLDAFPTTWASLASHCPELFAALADWLSKNQLRMLHYDPKHATLGERPDYVLSIAENVAHALRHPSADVARPTGAGVEAALSEAKAKLGPEPYAELERLVAQNRATYGLRDANGVETVSRPAGLLRHFVLELGRRIEADIGEREHAVYLYAEEHAAALSRNLPDIARTIERRRGEESWANANRGPKHLGPPRPPMPPFDAFPSGLARVMRIMSWMERAEATPEPTDGALRGVGLGTRVVTARARVILDPSDLVRVRHGEVLVCRITSPEWSVGAGRVAALVTNEGGALSHPAIIARELGITAVLGAADATLRITDGDLVRVDPTDGTVVVVKHA